MTDATIMEFLVAVLVLATACGPTGPLDADMDGVPDAQDWCNTVVEEPNGFEDEDGCPDVVPTEPVTLHFAGRWYGILTISPDGQLPVVSGSRTRAFSGSGVSIIAVREHDASIQLPCDEAITSRVVAMGAGATLEFVGPVVCTSLGSNNCPRRTIYSRGMIEYLGTRVKMTADGTYTAPDCSYSDVPATMVLDATLWYPL